jgi:hypothetical protein
MIETVGGSAGAGALRPSDPSTAATSTTRRRGFGITLQSLVGGPQLGNRSLGAQRGRAATAVTSIERPGTISSASTVTRAGYGSENVCLKASLKASKSPRSVR